MRRVTVLISFLFILFESAGQTRTVTGRVTGADGTGLPSVSVVVKGTKTGTTTTSDGSFSIPVSGSGSVLIFTSIGLETREVSVGSNSVLNVTLQASDKSLQEVVVVGYGLQQKRSFTGSSSKVDVTEFSNLITPSVDRELAGRATGVQVTTPGGSVNTPARIRIRGTNSISQNNDPLVVVDGVPIITGNLAASTNSNALGDINPADIESMEVLKDGSATAIYGSRAAAGVIMITTKRGTAGKAKVSYDGFVGYSSIARRFDLLNAEEFVMIANEKLANIGALPRAGVNPGGVSTDWQNEIYIKNAPTHNHTLSMQGGSPKTSYYFSLNYSDQKGVVFSNFNKSYRGRLNLDHEVNRFIKIGNSLTLSRQFDTDQNNGANSLGGSTAATIRLLPNVSPYDTSTTTGFNIAFPSNGWKVGPNSQQVDDNYQNVAFTLRHNQQSSEKYRIFDVFYVEVSPLSWVKFRTQLSADYFNDYSFLSWDPRHGDGFSQVGFVSNTSQNILRTVWQNYFNINKSFSDHSFFVTAGHEVQETNTKSFSASGNNIADIFFIKSNLISNSAGTQFAQGAINSAGFHSLFARFNYDFSNKYFAQVSIRRDGQSSLSEENRFGTFPGFSVGWRVSQENFWREFFGSSINEFKLKASYATVGNSLTGFPYLSTFSIANYGNLGGIAPNAIGTPDLRWEKSKKLDIGFDMSLFDNRFGITFDWFRNDIDDQVLAVPTPRSAGVPGGSISQNIGTSRNTGIEFSATGDVYRSKNFNWNISANYTNVSNRITSLYEINGVLVPEIANGNYALIRVGEPMNVIYGYNYAGVNSANGNPMYYNSQGQLIQHNIPTNTYHFVKASNDPTLGQATALSQADKIILGQGIPTYFGSVINSVNYKGFGLEVMLRYSGGNKVYNWTRQEGLLNQAFANNSREILDRWTTPGQVTDVPKLYFGQGNAINQSGHAVSRFAEDGDFVKLQSVVFSYTFGKDDVAKGSRGFLSGLRVYVQGQNLHTWTKYKGADPENISAIGLDQAVSPQVRIISGGVTVQF